MAKSPYGFWTSPITSDFVVADSIRLEQVPLSLGRRRRLGMALPTARQKLLSWFNRLATDGASLPPEMSGPGGWRPSGDLAGNPS